jgi:hypothetical protein
MTFLDIVKRTRQECGIAGDGPTTTVGQTREMKRLVDWVSQSYVEIQNEHEDWAFMRKSFSFLTQHGTTQTAGTTLMVGSVYEIVTRTTLDFDTVADLFTGASNTAGATYLITGTATLGVGDVTTLIGKQIYTVGSGATYDINLADFAYWRNDSFRSYLKSAGVGTEVILSQYYDFSQFRDFYLLGSRKLVTARPLYITIYPNDFSLMLGFTPNDVYYVHGEYYRTPHIMSADTDTPLFPAQFHMAIVYRAMEKYGLFEAASEQITAGKQFYSSYLNKMEAAYLPQIMSTGGFL